MKTILCLPGSWADRTEFHAACARAGLTAAGAFLVDPLLGSHVELELEGRDERMKRAFSAVSGGEISGPELDAIGEHRTVAYLLTDGGDLDKLRPLVQLAVRLLPHGALGIKVESAGVAAPIERWMQLAARFDPFSLIRCFVIVATGERDTYSCGMHNLGLPDVEVVDTPVDEAGKTINAFTLYTLLEKPDLKDGETFRREEGAPRFRLHKVPCTRFQPEDFFHNPFGVFRLERAR